jgi:hypothetical protein
MTNEELFAQAVARIKSASIQEWCQEEDNKTILLSIAGNWLCNRERSSVSRESDDHIVLRFSAWLVCEAMGF